MMDSVFKMMDFVLKMMNSVFKIMDFVLQMMNEKAKALYDGPANGTKMMNFVLKTKKF